MLYEVITDWGREHRDLSAITAIGVDEVQWQRGHRYLTLVYQIDTHCKRLLWVGKERKLNTLLGFFRWFGQERSAALKFVCSDIVITSYSIHYTKLYDAGNLVPTRIEDLVIYELHVGSLGFGGTGPGTLHNAIEFLDHLA